MIIARFSFASTMRLEKQFDSETRTAIC